MPLSAKCPRCQKALKFPLRTEGEPGEDWVLCGGCELRYFFDYRSLDPKGTKGALRFARKFRAPGYRLLGVLSAGGMGYLYSAVREDSEQLCAIKVLPPGLAEHPALVTRFRREVRIMRALRHPSLMPLLEASAEAPPFYFTMPYLPGRTLRSLLRERHRLAPEEVAAVVPAIGEALETVHQAGFLHRDVKPSNILLTCRGEAVLFDFGIAATVAEKSDLTEDGVSLGTPAYNAPEVYEWGARSAKSDQWALAVTIYEALTGQLPMGLFRRPSNWHPDFPTESEDALLQALQHDEADRFPSVRALSRAFLRPFTHQTPAGGTNARELLRALSQYEESFFRPATPQEGGPPSPAPPPLPRTGPSIGRLLGRFLFPGEGGSQG